MPPVRLRLIPLLLLATQLGCLGDLAPDPRPSEPSAFLSGLVDVMEARSYKRSQVDWTRLRDTVMARGSGARTLQEASPAMQLAFSLLGDNHSWLRLPDGSFLSYPKTLTCVAPAAASLTGLPADIGYVRISAFSGSTSQAEVFTRTIQDVYRAADSELLTGWIVDLRGNTGGNMWPMLSSLWPFMQGVTGHFVDANNRWTAWSVTGPIARLSGTALNEASAPFSPRGNGGRVAVLLDNAVASSGEAIAIALRGRANTRSFGAPTCGVSTGITNVNLRSNYTLGIAEVVMAGRDSLRYGGAVPVDEPIATSDALAARAIAWIRSGQ
jgi:hypothetical protein